MQQRPLHAKQFDRSLLPEALFEFVVVADTHYMLDLGNQSVEFESRRKQSQRARTAFEWIAALEPELVVHLGDLVQEYPASPRFEQALREARTQWESFGLRPHVVAGNHDVGDIPDPTMPADPVTSESLAFFHQNVGRSWYSFDHRGIHFVLLNSQLMNSALPDAEVQRNWIQEDLANHADCRTFVFLHMPPYLGDEHEPGLGHYDNLDEPDRSWLMDLVRRYHVELLVAGHVHFAFFDRIGRTRYCVMPSTSFTRPGFGHLFASAPAPEQGRDDAEKLGFTLFRVFEDHCSRHFLRTAGATGRTKQRPTVAGRLMTATSVDLDASPLGQTLVHPLAPKAEVPIAWPSVIRQPVRNDYPLLALVELGVKHVRAPVQDFMDATNSRRLAILREESIALTATVVWTEALDARALLEASSDAIDAWEFQFPGRTFPSQPMLAWLRRWQSVSQAPSSLAPVHPRHVVRGKQHPRTRIGFAIEELAELNDRLAQEDLRIDRVLCHVDSEANPFDAVLSLWQVPLSQIGAVDLSVALDDLDDHANALRVAESLFAVGLMPGSRLYYEPLIDLDRTMDVRHGLLDPLCNPRPAFHVLRCLNTILFSSTAGVFPAERHLAQSQPSDVSWAGARVIILRTETSTAALILPETSQSSVQLPEEGNTLGATSGNQERILYRLTAGTSEALTWDGLRQTMQSSPLEGPGLVVFRR